MKRACSELLAGFGAALPTAIMLNINTRYDTLQNEDGENIFDSNNMGRLRRAQPMKEGIEVFSTGLIYFFIAVFIKIAVAADCILYTMPRRSRVDIRRLEADVDELLWHLQPSSFAGRV